MLRCFSCIQLFVTPWTVAHQATLSWDSSGKNTGCPALLQGIFLTQGVKPSLLGLLHWQAGSLTGPKKAKLCHIAGCLKEHGNRFSNLRAPDNGRRSSVPVKGPYISISVVVFYSSRIQSATLSKLHLFHGGCQ